MEELEGVMMGNDTVAAVPVITLRAGSKTAGHPFQVRKAHNTVHRFKKPRDPFLSTALGP